MNDMTAGRDTAPLDHRKEVPAPSGPLGRISGAPRDPLSVIRAARDKARAALPSPTAEEKTAKAAAIAHGAALIDPLGTLPDEALIARFGAHRAARLGLLPWRQAGGAVIVLTPWPDSFARHRDALQKTFGRIRMAVTTQSALEGALRRAAGHSLRHRAETRVAASESCRDWKAGRAALVLGLALASLLTALVLAPATTVVAICGWTILALIASTTVKALAAWQVIRDRAPDHAEPAAVPHSLPVISVIVPLLREKRIAEHLLARLGAIDYPRDRLEIRFALEEDDETTRKTLLKTPLPPWIRTIAVPRGTLKTKPRALNFALDFCQGSIIGIYDAEDAPAPDQLRKVAARFAAFGPDVACLQGALDYYNPHVNWLTRCFTIEYAAWSRMILPGFRKLGLPIPLGGTTLFFRREILEELGGWDAHNVTEDADLGIRLARRGYRTELLDSVTGEEANGRAWPWVKQRSRWLKGYAITYAVHMRRPVQLWRELGPRGFFAVQVIFLGTLTQFTLAPVFWSFWLIPFGGLAATRELLGSALWPIISLFLLSELVNLIIGLLALRRTTHRGLAWWLPMMHLYFPLAALASYKALWELACRPFYWDKTAHGLLLGPAASVTPPPPQPPHPA
ncbi:glycosyltransferase family 2 protein [Aestuariibius sp. 2305UL40-4]|uniref:glycosyltransferase family 2 protein n=1 Tax=Aestuariibius violaceus TaxID=3234132 RepID=UPI00345EAD5F